MQKNEKKSVTGTTIYKAFSNFAVSLNTRIGRMPNDFKSTLGKQLSESSVNLMLNVAEVYKCSNKTEAFEELMDELARMKCLLEICNSMELLKSRSLGVLMSSFVSGCKQAETWKNSYERKIKVNVENIF